MKLDEVTGVVKEPRTFAPSPLLPTNDFVGVEVELEGFAFQREWRFESNFWDVKDDPSLRGGGKEFLYHAPLNGEDVITSLSEFDTFIEWYEDHYGKDKIDCSERTSVHVHLDVRNMTSQQLLNLGLVNMTFEPALLRVFGPGREDSNYCLPMSKGTDRFRLAGLMKDDIPSVITALNSSKYSSFNTLPVKTQGSVEFRIHVGTKNGSDLMNWICVILWMKKYAMEMEVDWVKYPEYVSEMGMDQYVRLVFKDRAEQFLYQGYQEDLYNGTRVAQDTVIRNKLKEAHLEAVSKEGENPAAALFAEKHSEDVGMPVEDEDEPKLRVEMGEWNFPDPAGGRIPPKPRVANPLHDLDDLFDMGAVAEQEDEDEEDDDEPDRGDF